MKTSKITGKRIKEYLEKENKRFDGRAADEFRELILEKDVSKNAEGSVRVKLGKTEVIVGVKLGLAEPYSDSPNKGNLMTTAELLPLSSERFELGPPKFSAIELGRVIDRGVRESGYIDFEKLCIREGEKVWNIFIDIYSINDDGNLFDAAGIGAIVALKLAKLPVYNEEEDKIDYEAESTEMVPVADEMPIAITTYKLGNSIIVDPTREEEDLIDTRVTIGSTAGRISSLQKGEPVAMTIEEMEKAIDASDIAYKKISEKIEKFLK
jgi:exosome complex component RRP42